MSTLSSCQIWMLSNPSAHPKIKAVPIRSEEKLLAWGVLLEGGWGLLESGLLVIWDSQGKRRDFQQLPMEGVRANGRAVEVANRWFIYCVVEDLSGQSHLWIMEKETHRLKIVLHRLLPGFLCSTTKPFVIKRSTVPEIIFSGMSSQRASLQLITLESPYRIKEVQAAGGAFTSIEAIDIWGREICDRLYASNDKGVWLLDFLNTGHPQFQLRSKSQAFGRCRVVHHPDKNALRLFYIGALCGQKGLLVLDEPLQKTLQILEPKLVVPGDWFSFEIRFGALLMVPRKLSTPVILVDFEGVRIRTFQIPLEGTLDFFGKCPSGVSSQDKYFFMNLSGQLILYTYPDFSRQVKGFYFQNR